jgi:translation initiation factor 2 subunit 1
MLFRREGYPEEDDLVMCTVTKVQSNSVFVNVDEYQKQGMIHISEISPGRIRNIRDFVKEGKVIVCKVLRVNPERGHIDLSLRRVNEAQRRAKVEEMKQEQKAEKIVEFVAVTFKINFPEVYRELFSKIAKDYGMLNHAFGAVAEESLSLEKLGIDKKLAQALEKEIKHRIKPTEVSVHGEITLKSFEPDGIEVVKESLQKALSVSESVEIKYLGGGKYHIIVTASDYPSAEQLLQQATDGAIKHAESRNSFGSFVKEEQ